MHVFFKVWDDVVRKEKPKEEVFEYKKRLTLDHEKSKLSLAEVYEQEYLKQTQVSFVHCLYMVQTSNLLRLHIYIILYK